MKILLTGRNGQVGRELERALQPVGTVLATERATLNLANVEDLRRRVRETKPDVIVNAAAYTAVDKAETEPDLAQRVNGEAPAVLAEEARQLGALLVHYSTDYIFDGTKGSPYAEEDAPNPLNVYGRTKLAGERAVQQSECRYLILRTSWVYGPHGKNFYRTIRAKAAAGEALRVVNDQRGVPTSSAFVADFTVELMRKDTRGVLNLVPSGETTWFEFARTIVATAGRAVEVRPISSAEFPSAARRPAYSVLSNAKAGAALGQRIADWREFVPAMGESR